MIKANRHAGAALDELIVASAGGDEDSFHRLYQLTVDTLYGVALRILRRPDWAEEVVQESYVSVWRHAARFDRNKGAPMTWLIRIVRNKSFDWIHASRADGHERLHGISVVTFGDEDVEIFGATDPDGDTTNGFEYRQRAARIADCLDLLDARQRQSISLVFFHGLSHGELARHLQQPLGTVKAWVRRGLAALRGCLAGQH